MQCNCVSCKQKWTNDDKDKGDNNIFSDDEDNDDVVAQLSYINVLVMIMNKVKKQCPWHLFAKMKRKKRLNS